MKMYDYKKCRDGDFGVPPGSVKGIPASNEEDLCTFGVDKFYRTFEATCQGDSGGGLFIDTNTASVSSAQTTPGSSHDYVITGVTSRGKHKFFFTKSRISSPPAYGNVKSKVLQMVFRVQSR